MLNVEAISRSYGRFLALNGLSFSIGKGAILGFVGPNGAGKTTAMSIITGLLAADSGAVHLGDDEVHATPSLVKSRIGFLPETPPLYTAMEVSEYLRFCGEARGMDRQQLGERLENVLANTGLSARRNMPISTLSRGYRQRAGLAQALLHDPDLLVLDEPTSGLDPAQILDMHELLRGLAAQGKIVIFSTHILSEVEAIASHILIINHGRCLAFGERSALLGADGKERGLTDLFISLVKKRNP
ncbi:MAG: ABC transporter ATP-binding protein [Planctomycetes bacterium]|nr:ABC transporter ATP-binding protein [Planctomycetota bacterium]NUQ33661.1 ABC transporter ATP-binding protein [Planctomycetaceae bacterium]